MNITPVNVLMHSCRECNFFYPDFMLKNSVWQNEVKLPYRILPPEKPAVLCLCCVEKIIRRELTPNDFLSGVPVNDGYFFGYARAAKRPEIYERHLAIKLRRDAMLLYGTTKERRMEVKDQMAALRMEANEMDILA